MLTQDMESNTERRPAPQESWQLWRQDDNGNRFLVAASENRACLERQQRELEQGGHKQSYWITRSNG
jgi:hypothetical protein